MRMYRMNSALVRMVLGAILSCQSRAQRHDSWSAIISLPAIVNACCNEMYCIQYASDQGLRTDAALTVSVFGDRMQRDLSSPAAASVPGADKLRAAYCSDAGLQARINGVMSESHIDVDLEAESGDAVWKGCLRQWASV